MHVYKAANATVDAIDERCLATHLEHGERWGYPTHILREDVRGKGQWRELIFSKPLYMLSIAVAEMAKPAAERAEWLVFFDADTILLNANIPWAIFLPPSDFSNIYFLGSRDWGENGGFNAGVFFVRINEWSVKMLTEVAALPDLRSDVEVGYNAEQAAFQWTLKRAGYREHVIYQPVQWYNGFERSYDHLPQVRDGDMLVHFSGMKNDRFGPAKRWLDRLEHAPHELQIQLDNTKYQANIDAYWSKIREARIMIQTVDQLSDGSAATQELLIAQAELQQVVLNKADKPALLTGAKHKVKSALAATKNTAKSPGEGFIVKQS